MRALNMLVMALVLGGFSGTEGALGAAASAPQTVSGGGVTVKVAYLNPNTAEDPRFQVVLDTHSVNLDVYDLKSITVLRDDTGRDYVPTAVESKGAGHHREVTLTFPTTPPGAKRLEMVIKGVAGVKERVFRWDLE